MGKYFTKHFLDRLRDRNISRHLIEQILSNPDTMRPQQGLLTIEGRGIRIIARKRRQHLILITAYRI